MPNNKGKFIVIDGTDGSGKATQTALLVQKLRAAGYDVEVADFPQYGQKSAGLVEEYLNGKYGTADEVGPYRGSIFYACDRYDASFKIKKWIGEGKIIVSNRYVTANMGHQGGKIKDRAERKKYFDWLYNLEYEIFGIPRPDLNIILHVDASVAQQLVDGKGAREYVGGTKRDIHEADLEHLKNAEKVYLEIAGSFPDFALIECTRGEKIMPKEEINNLLWEKVTALLKPAVEEIIFTPTKAAVLDTKKFWDTGTAPNLEKNISVDFKKSYVEIHGEIPDREEIPTPIHGDLQVEKISPQAKLPARAHETDAGLDLFSLDYYSLAPLEKITMRTGIKMAIPDGYVGLVWDKSGLSQQGLYTGGGVIDSGYRGEIMINMINLSNGIKQIAPGQKIAQMLIQKIELPQIIEGRVNSDTSRGNSGFGSTGKF